MSFQLAVRHHRALYLLPRGHPEPAAVRHRLDTLVERRLPDLTSRVLSAALDPADPRVWRIRRLEVGLAVDLGAVDDALLARAWAERLAREVKRLVTRGPDGEEVLCFDDRAAYLARFTADLAAGRAWGRWYYRAFASLRPLERSPAIREALVREPDAVAPALARLAADGALPSVLAVLRDADAERILAAGSPSAVGAGTSERVRFEALLDAWRRMGDPLAQGSRAGAALLLFATAVAGRPDLAPGLGATAGRLADLALLLRRTPRPGRLCDLLAAGDLAAAAALAREGGPSGALAALPALGRLARGDRGWLREVAGTVAPGAAPRPAAGTPSPEVLSTPFAGVFFLLPSYLALGLDEVLGGDPALRHRVLARCFGAAQAGAAAEDPALALAAGAAAEPGETTGEPAAAAERAGEILSSLRRRLAEEGRAEGRCLAVELVSVGAGAVLLLRDAAADHWLAARPVSGPGEPAVRALRRELEELAAAAGAPPEHLLLGPGLGRLLADRPRTPFRVRLLWSEDPPDAAASLVPSLTKVPEEPGLCAREARPLSAEASRRLRVFRARARPAAAELRYFAGSSLGPTEGRPERERARFVRRGRDWTGHHDLEQVVVLLAHAVLRHVAGRLPGFEWSGGEHLRKNFLAGHGEVTSTPEGLAVRLPPSPLRLVARMAGADGMTYEIPWLDARRVTLTLPEG